MTNLLECLYPRLLACLASPRVLVFAGLMVLFWTWETLQPSRRFGPGRVRHALRNFLLALINFTALAFTLGLVFVLVTDWTSQEHIGLLHQLALPSPWDTLLALLLLDAWTYAWHRANHTLPWLWRFHKVHHTENRMDVTSAVRFHTGELALSALLRLALVPLLGLAAWQVILYDGILLGVTLFHHANISLGRSDPWLRWLIVTPAMHQVHHSRVRAEADSNYASVLSVWDRLGRSWRRLDPATVRFGVQGYEDAAWQTLPAMLKTPFISTDAPSAPGAPTPDKTSTEDKPVLQTSLPPCRQSQVPVHSGSGNQGY